MFKIILTIGSIQTIAILVNLVRTKLVAILVGPEGVGIISSIDQIVQTVSYVSGLSLPVASIKFLSKAHSESDTLFEQTYTGFLNVLLLLAASGLIVALFILLFSPGILGQDVMKYRTILSVALLGLPAMVLGGYLANVLAAGQGFRKASLLAVIANFTTTIACIFGIAAGGILGLYIGNVLAGIALTVMVLIYFKTSLGLPLTKRGISFIDELKRNPGILSFSFMIYLGTITYSIALLVARYSVLMNFGEATAGLLQGAIAIALGIGMVLNPVNGLYLTPIMNRTISKVEKFQVAMEFQRKLLIILCLVAAVPVLFPKLILTLLMSTQFVDAAAFVCLFVIWQCIVQLSDVNRALLIGFDDMKAYTVITCAGFITLALVSWLLVSSAGILGVSYACIISAALIYLLSMARLKLMHDCNFPDTTIILICYGIGGIFIAGTISVNFEEWNVMGVVLKLLSYFLFLLSLLLFLNKEERAALLLFWDRFVLRKCEL